MKDGPQDGTPLILFNEIEPGIAVLTLNRPQARNALSRAAQKGTSGAYSTVLKKVQKRSGVSKGKKSKR